MEWKITLIDAGERIAIIGLIGLWLWRVSILSAPNV